MFGMTTEHDLDHLLRALRDELATTEFADERSREVASRLARETEELAALRAKAPPAALPAPPSTFAGRLAAAVEHFEATHPALTETMQRIVKALGDAGL